MYFVKLTDVYAIPHSPQILKFLLSFPIKKYEKSIVIKTFVDYQNCHQGLVFGFSIVFPIISHVFPTSSVPSPH